MSDPSGSDEKKPWISGGPSMYRHPAERLPTDMCAPRALGFVPSRVFALCRSEDRISGLLYRERSRFWSRLNFWRTTGYFLKNRFPEDFARA